MGSSSYYLNTIGDTPGHPFIISSMSLFINPFLKSLLVQQTPSHKYSSILTPCMRQTRYQKGRACYFLPKLTMRKIIFYEVNKSRSCGYKLPIMSPPNHSLPFPLYIHVNHNPGFGATESFEFSTQKLGFLEYIWNQRHPKNIVLLGCNTDMSLSHFLTLSEVSFFVRFKFNPSMAPKLSFPGSFYFYSYKEWGEESLPEF